MSAYVPPTGAVDANGNPDPNAGYVGKNIAAGKQGSKVPPGAIEYPQRELAALAVAAGLSPTNSVLTQAAQALARGVFVGNLTGAGDLAVATLGVVFPLFLQGMRVSGVATAPNATTTPKLRIVGLGTPTGFLDFPILLEDGSAPAVGAIKAGRRYRYEADGAGNVMISGGGIGTSAVGTNTSGQLGAVVLYTTLGSSNWTVPANWLRVRARPVGGGGGGSGTDGCAGGAGETAGIDFDVTPGGTVACLVGAGGNGVASGTAGNGGASSVPGCTVNGGYGGSNSTSTPGVGGSGGTGGFDRVAGGSGLDLDGYELAAGGGTPAYASSSKYGQSALYSYGEGGLATASGSGVGATGNAGKQGAIRFECIKAA